MSAPVKHPWTAPVPPEIPSADSQPDTCGLDNWEPKFEPECAIPWLPADEGGVGISKTDYEAESE